MLRYVRFNNPTVTIYFVQMKWLTFQFNLEKIKVYI
jgi:hypothetical protein